MLYRDTDDHREFGSQHEEPDFAAQCTVAFIDAEKHPVIAAVNGIAAELVGILGPMMWAALIVLSLVAEFSSN